MAPALVCNAQGANAVPELIHVDERDRQTETGSALSIALDRYRETLVNDESVALEHAKEIVALCVRLWGETDPRVARALTNLAIAQSEMAQYALARDNFRAAIRVAEVAENSIITPALINPLRGLAATNVALNEIARAIPAYERAIHISHVNEGPNNTGQVEVMRALSNAHLFLRDIDSATNIRENMYRLQQRQFAQHEDGYADALLDRARWYRRILDFDEATKEYQRLQKLLTDTHGADDIRLVEPLIELAFVAPGQQSGTNSFIVDPDGLRPMDDGLRAIKQAVRIARQHADDDALLLPRTLTNSGDWMLFAGKPREARLAYTEAWHLAAADPRLRAWREHIFLAPSLVTRVNLRSLYEKNIEATPAAVSGMPDRGHVEVTFRVSTDGRPVDLRVTSSEPPGLMDAYVLKKLKRFAYRPALRDGQAVATDGMTFRHEFRFDEKRLSRRDVRFVESARAQREAGEPLQAGKRGRDRPAPPTAPPDGEY